MVDQRAQKFFQLTECNIQAIGLPEKFHVKRKENLKQQCFFSVLSLSLLLLIGVIYLMVAKQAPITSAPRSSAESRHLTGKPQNVGVKTNMRLLESAIPPFHLAATREMLQMIPLRRAELFMVRSEDAEDVLRGNSMVMMDKVIIMPKMVLSNVRQVA